MPIFQLPLRDNSLHMCLNYKNTVFPLLHTANYPLDNKQRSATVLLKYLLVLMRLA